MRTGLLAEFVPFAGALLGEVIVPIAPAPGERGDDAEATPRVSARSGLLGVALAMEEIVQEPIDGVDVIEPLSPCQEPCILDQRFNGPVGIDLRRDTAKQIVNLRRILTVHWGSLAARLIHLP